MATLTKAEKAWIAKLQKVLNECPSDRIGAYTIGDPDLELYDRTLDASIEALQEDSSMDFCTAVEEVGGDLGCLKFPFPIHSTAG